MVRVSHGATVFCTKGRPCFMPQPCGAHPCASSSTLCQLSVCPSTLYRVPGCTAVMSTDLVDFGPKSNSSKKPQVGLLSLSVPGLPLQGPSITISASNLLLTVSTQFHVQATNAVLIRHPSAWGLWLRASGQLTPTVHSSFNFSHVQVLSPAHVGLMEPEERGSKSRLCPTTGCVWASLQEPNNRERWDSRGPRGVGCQSRWPGGRDKNVHPHRITWCHPLP